MGCGACGRPPSLPLATFARYALPARSPAVEMIRPQEIEFAATRTLILPASTPLRAAAGSVVD
jgi:hypothetical protein